MFIVAFALKQTNGLLVIVENGLTADCGELPKDIEIMALIYENTTQSGQPPIHLKHRAFRTPSIATTIRPSWSLVTVVVYYCSDASISVINDFTLHYIFVRGVTSKEKARYLRFSLIFQLVQSLTYAYFSTRIIPGINGLLHHDGLLPPGFPTAFIYLVILSLSLIYAFSAL